MSPVEGAGNVDASLRPSAVGLSAYQLWQIQKMRADLRKEYLDHWQKTAEKTGTGRPVDAIVSPGAPFAAPPHGKNGCVIRFYLRHRGLDW